jgi:mycofactocin precursor
MAEPEAQEMLVTDAPEPPVVEDVLVEEVSIDGMCGVY